MVPVHVKHHVYLLSQNALSTRVPLSCCSDPINNNNTVSWTFVVLSVLIGLCYRLGVIKQSVMEELKLAKQSVRDEHASV